MVRRSERREYPMTLLIIPIALFAYGFMRSLVGFWPEFIALMDGQGKEWR